MLYPIATDEFIDSLAQNEIWMQILIFKNFKCYRIIISRSKFQADTGIAWATNAEGVGSWIELTFDKATSIDMMRYANRDAFSFSAEDSNRQVTLSFSDGSITVVELIDTTNVADDWQHEYHFPQVTTTFVRITVNTVWGAVNSGAEEIAFYNHGDCGIIQKTN